AQTAGTAGIKILHLPTKSIMAELTFKASVDEIYEVCVFPATTRPNVLNTINPIHKFSLSIPGSTFWANPDQAGVQA
ncbi:MAG TPA: hypothetical protein VD905_15540, partial [Flavobacteriales bacterium]|nr:hypothetical protein [Flavobacteriales bacterium]